MGCILLVIGWSVVSLDALAFETCGWWGLVPVAAELLAGWLALIFW